MFQRVGMVLLLVLGLLLIVFHENVIEWLDEIFGTPDPRPVIAMLERFDGEVNFKLPKTLVYRKVKVGMNLRDQDTVVTNSQSSAVISFDSGFRLEVASNSIIVVEQPQVGEGGAIRVTFLRGDFRILNQGQGGQLILSKDDKLQDAAGRAPPAMPIQIVAHAAPAPEPPPVPIPEPELKADVMEEIKTVLKAPAPPPPKKRESLPDDYIAQIIRKQTPFFNRCYAEHLRLKPNARGRIQLSFTISQAGLVTGVRLLGSTLKDPRLEQCTMSVVERAKFRKFEGDAIIVNYPINFE